MKLTTFIAQFFQEDSGMSSATRLGFIVWSLGVFAIWAILCLYKKEILSLPPSIVEISGLFIVGKVGGAYVETKYSNTSKLPDGFQMPPQQ